MTFDIFKTNASMYRMFNAFNETFALTTNGINRFCIYNFDDYKFFYMNEFFKFIYPIFIIILFIILFRFILEKILKRKILIKMFSLKYIFTFKFYKSLITAFTTNQLKIFIILWFPLEEINLLYDIQDILQYLILVKTIQTISYIYW